MSSTFVRILAAPAVVLALGASAQAADHVVMPGQSIQAAIQAASDGDRVLVQPGTYAEAIDLLGKDLEVVGVGGAAATTIDASGLGTSVVTLANGEPASALLRGFTITGGVGQAFGSAFGGGGVLARDGAQGTIRACRIVGNALAQPGQGAGVLAAVTFVTPSSHLTIEDSVIADNAGRGASGSLTLRRCSVLRNTGGGVEAQGQLAMEDCLIAANTTAGNGGGLVTNFATLALDLQRCVFIGNQAASGGAIHHSKVVAFGGAQFANCIFIGNTAVTDGGAIDAFHAAEAVFSGGIRVSRCIFSGNSAGVNGGAVNLDADNASIVVEHCTFGRNSSGIFAEGTQLLVRDSVLRQVNPITANGPVTVNGCNVAPDFPAFPGEGNFTADPKFVDEQHDDLRLRADSPCIDLPEALPTPNDAEGDPQLGDADVGGDEFHPHLKVLGVPAPGSTVTFSVIGPAGAPFTILFMGLSLAETPIPTPHGDLLLGDILAPLTIVLPPLPASGYLGIPLTLAPALPPANVHLQAFVASGPSSGTFTNVESVRID